MKSVVWITGLSGAGKSTLAARLVDYIRSSGRSVVMLDGDHLREIFGVATVNPEHNSRDIRIRLAMSYARLCRAIAEQNQIVVIATISLFREVHIWNRMNLPGYCEIYLKVPIQELRRRDPKGIYQRFDKGEILNVAGLDLKVDEPSDPDLKLEFTEGSSIEDNALKLISFFESRQKS